MRILSLAGAILLLALTGCGNEAGAAASLPGHSYLSTAVSENGKPKQLAPNTQVRLEFTNDGNLVSDAGCNSTQTKVSTGGGKLTLSGQAASTAVGCPAAQQQQDSWLANVLSAKPTWKLDGSKLEITAGSTTIFLEDSKTAKPAIALDDTTWSLSGVVSGDTVGHPANSHDAWMKLNGERVTGSTGCNEFQGTVARAPGKLTFGELATTRLACASEAAKLEASVLSVLKGDVTYKLDANTLQLRGATAGLDFIAAR